MKSAIVLTADVGAGHTGAAQAWAARLGGNAFTVDVLDLVNVLPAWGAGTRDLYRPVLQHAPWLWAAGIGLSGTRPAVRAVDAALKRSLPALARVIPPSTDLVLSTYPLAGRMVEMLRRRGELNATAATFVTDSFVHPLCITGGTLLVLHPDAERQARAQGATDVRVTGPVVDQRFHPASAEEQAAARREFGLPGSGRLALVTGGSLGIGPITRSVRDIEATGVARAVVVCGHNENLRARLAAEGLGFPLGWVREMDRLMRAADLLVDNAGGLTSLEAMASGLPVITYRPLAGHGSRNARAAARSGMTVWVTHPRSLAPILRSVPDGPVGRRLRESAGELFSPDRGLGTAAPDGEVRLGSGAGSPGARGVPGCVAAPRP